VQTIIDLDEQSVIKVLDSGVIPIPADNHNFDEATVASKYGLRPAMKPIRITQPEGVNFTMNGHFLEWQKWRFHLRFERRAGTVISLVTFDGRSVLYQGALGEIFVPYQTRTSTGSTGPSWMPGSLAWACWLPPWPVAWMCPRMRFC